MCRFHMDIARKGLSIYYVIRDRGGGVFPIYYNVTMLGGEGLPNLLQYNIGGFFKVYYNFTDLVGVSKGIDHFQ